MTDLKLVLPVSFTLRVNRATPCAARPLVRTAALQLVGIAGYSSSLRLALHPMGHTAHVVQLPFLGSSYRPRRDLKRPFDTHLMLRDGLLSTLFIDLR